MFYVIGIGSNEDGRNRVSGINEAIAQCGARYKAASLDFPPARQLGRAAPGALLIGLRIDHFPTKHSIHACGVDQCQRRDEESRSPEHEPEGRGR